MKLPFLDRHDEAARLRRFVDETSSSLALVYGRRRLGKSRLIQETLPEDRAVYYMADDRADILQRAAVAREIGRRLPGFERVHYPDWDALFERFFHAAPAGLVLTLDELPALATAAPEVPSVLQRHLDRRRPHGPHVVLSGSSQRMMQGLVLDRTAPLFGRATEILKISPLGCGWLPRALGLRDPVACVEAFAVWGGVPRYWELARSFPDREAAVEALILSPLGVLHDEPEALLLDDLGEITQPASILTLIGQGCHRMSEIAARLGKPATSLSRPLQRLVELELVRRDIPFDAAPRDNKRSLYRIADPFLRFWFRFVDPNRSRLEARRLAPVTREIRDGFASHVAGVWEDLVRQSIPRHRWFERDWKPAASFWGPGLDRRPLEIDVVAESEDGAELLVGEVKWTSLKNLGEVISSLRSRAAQLPFAAGKRVHLGIWAKEAAGRLDGVQGFGASAVVKALR
jgi:AAA+ ATPase superfamily predicted ATPase